MFTPGRLPRTNLPARYVYNVISTEALSVHKPMIGTVQKLAGFIQDVAQGFKNTNIIGAIDTLLKKDKDFTGNERKVLEMLGRTPYTDIADIRLPCMAGLSVTWLELLHDIEPGIGFVVNFYDTTLGQTTKFLAEINTAPEKMEQIARRYNIHDVDFEKLTQNIGRDVSGPGKKAEQRFGKLVKRNADMIDTITLTNRFSEQIYSSNQDLVTERIGIIKKQLEVVSEGIIDPNIAYRMSSKNVDQLAKVAFNIAQAVEYYGVIITLFTEHKRTFEQAVEKLARLH